MTHVHDGHARQARRKPFAELQPLEPRPALGSRRSAPVDGDGTLESGPLGSYGARVVARVRLLLVRRIVLLVDAHDTEAAHRREDGGARADDDSRLPRSDPFTLVAPLRLREPGVEHRHEVAETRAEATERLRRERDLRDEDDGVAAAGHCRRTGAEVHLGLAAPRLAPEQEMPSTVSQRLLDAPDRCLLRSAQHDGCLLGGERVRLGGRAPFAAPCPRRRSHERERPGRRRAVVLGHPQRKIDERRRNVVDDAVDRHRLDAFGHRSLVADDNPADLGSA